MNNEIWKDIPGYSGLYQISNKGCVISYCGFHNVTQRILRPQITQNGYYQVSLKIHGKVQRFKIHRLVAMAFIPNPRNLPQINHRNEIKTDNRVENLEWCTPQYNVCYGTGLERRAKKRGKRVECVETGIVYYSCGNAAQMMNLDFSHISKCCRGLLPQHKGFHFKYV